MSNFNFRIRINKTLSETIAIKYPNKSLNISSLNLKVNISSTDDTVTIEKAQVLSIIGADLSSEDEAKEIGERFQNGLMITLAQLRIGADFGSRAPKSFITKKGIELIEEGLDKRILNDVHGLMIYNSEPPPLFVSQYLNLGISTSESHFEDILQDTFSKSFNITSIERLAFDFFNMSFFQRNVEAKFIALMIAIEILIDRKPRNKSVLEFIDKTIVLAKSEIKISDEERTRIISGLNDLKNESISQAGKRLTDETLPTKLYQKLTAGEFFIHCYKIRSRLVHGSSSIPSYDEIAKVVGDLEIFVSDLLVKSVLK